MKTRYTGNAHMALNAASGSAFHYQSQNYPQAKSKYGNKSNKISGGAGLYILGAVPERCFGWAFVCSPTTDMAHKQFMAARHGNDNAVNSENLRRHCESMATNSKIRARRGIPGKSSVFIRMNSAGRCACAAPNRFSTTKGN